MNYIDIDFNALKIFVSVYENEGILSASKKLYISQPAVSMSIKKLEENLGGKLFIRLKKGIKPTPEGERFYQFCKKALNNIKDGYEDFSEYSFIKRGSLSIGSSSAIIKHFLMDKVVSFCQKYKDIEISFTEVINKRLYRYLNNGAIDFAIIEGPIENEELYEVILLKEIENIFISTSSYDSEDIEDVVVLKKDSGNRKIFDSFNENNKYKVKYEMASYETLLDFIEKTNKVGFIAKEFVNLNKDFLRIGNEKIHNNLYLILPKGKNNSFAVNKFLEYIKKI